MAKEEGPAVSHSVPAALSAGEREARCVVCGLPRSECTGERSAEERAALRAAPTSHKEGEK